MKPPTPSIQDCVAAWRRRSAAGSSRLAAPAAQGDNDQGVEISCTPAPRCAGSEVMMFSFANTGYVVDS